MHSAIRAEYDRLVREEYQKDPSKAKYIAKGFYVEKIAKDPRFSVNDPSHIHKIINGYNGGKRGK